MFKPGDKIRVRPDKRGHFASWFYVQTLTVKKYIEEENDVAFVYNSPVMGEGCSETDAADLYELVTPAELKEGGIEYV